MTCIYDRLSSIKINCLRDALDCHANFVTTWIQILIFDFSIAIKYETCDMSRRRELAFYIIIFSLLILYYYYYQLWIAR